MEIATSTRAFPLTAALQETLQRRLNFALDRYRHVIRRVQVQLSDLNGPRGGNDKRCHLQLDLAGQPPLVIRDTDADLYRAIGRAARRAAHQLSRRLDRRQQRDRTALDG